MTARNGAPPRKRRRPRERIVEEPSPWQRAMRALPRADRPKAMAMLRDLERRAFSEPPTPDRYEAVVRLAWLTTRPRILIEEDA